MSKQEKTKKPRINFVDDDEADAFISEDALALLIGMVLDQQQTIEKAFRGPLDLVKRMGREPIPGALDAAEIAGMPAEEMKALFSIVPALHRFPASNAARTQELCAHIVTEYDGNPSALWTTAENGVELFKRMNKVPGFGKRKARIFVAVVGKRLGIELVGWREAAGEFGEANVLRSVADIDGPETKAAYRELKKAAKDAAGEGKPETKAKQGKSAQTVASKAFGPSLSPEQTVPSTYRRVGSAAPALATEQSPSRKRKVSSTSKQDQSVQTAGAKDLGAAKLVKVTKTMRAPSAKKKV